MAKTKNFLLISSVLLVALVFPYVAASDYSVSSPPAKPYDKKNDVIVEGIVYCQSCDYSGTWSLEDAEPISGATISVICRKNSGRINYYKAFTTSEEGYFYAKLDGFAMRDPLLDHPLQACAVKLVDSPLETCDVFTNINYGIKGASLRYEKKSFVTENYQTVIYSAGPLAFRPENCPPKP
ncbi:non-classical arabinogalactan protein 30 [Silene latifolia]|uniref:non-classical arabinogalactan protein 30 n=1 Tax=Silene latifolia TaxID=37657 RepID=UPI003D78A7C1